MTLITYTDRYLDWQLGEGHPTNPVRARLAVEMLKTDERMQVREDWAGIDTPAEWIGYLQTVHTSDYLNRVLMDGICGEWAGASDTLARTALTMFGGTQVLVDEYLSGSPHRVFFNPQGAKHHAQADHSSGFCVFNDMAAAALRLADAGKCVVYVDWDAHAGDGVENILSDRSDIWTFSIHEERLFPWTDNVCKSGQWNYPLDACAGNIELIDAIAEVSEHIKETSPDVVLVACGADGHVDDPLSTLRYTLNGMDDAARRIADSAAFVGASAIIGGAGGYQPHSVTPEHWHSVVKIFTDVLEDSDS